MKIVVLTLALVFGGCCFGSFHKRCPKNSASLKSCPKGEVLKDGKCRKVEAR